MKTKALLPICLILLATARPASGQFFDLSDAPVLAKLGEMLRVHRAHLVEAIRTARGIETTFRTLKQLDEYERNLRRDISFVSSMDLTRLNDLERLIMYGDQTDFYLRSLTGKINRDMYNLSQMERYGDGFLGSVDGLGLIDANLIRALFADDKSLEELGIPPEQVEALLKELNIESTMLDLYQVQGTQNLVKALANQGQQLKEVARDSSIEMDQGQRVMLLAKSEESLIEALKFQQELADRLKERNEKISRKLHLKAELEAEINELEKFYNWHASQEHNLGFFDSEFIKREKF
ncbi:hypothetical protein GWO43_27375 [candidate division KSB1 bacterium]|nr:hypothetical protein [candidate division KSB1 bacterium]NIR70505.1 hypothetical protein [candidate division KSB1 bacterium]NIS27680.1 hypothetical protein [candidate division KSB1 bacterium]NIT74515.1 hypothetical protein [candidate division KSB1 bacterium]NIU23754.1 hypothetical protein [candidate division KSB1 bacterium]